MTSFGEIVEPVSRAAWEDWDEISTEGSNTMLNWKIPLDIPDKIEAFFILEGKFLADIVKAQSEEQVKLINTVTEANLCLFKIQSSDKYVCSIKDYNLLHSSEIIELIKLFILKSNDVITVQTKPLIEHQTDTLTTKPWVIRQIKTQKLSTNNLYNFNFGRLEQPNIISGVGAGAICLREHSDLPATALVYYIENMEEYQAEEICSLLENLQIIKKSTTKFCGILSSNLYI